MKLGHDVQHVGIRHRLLNDMSRVSGGDVDGRSIRLSDEGDGEEEVGESHDGSM